MFTVHDIKITGDVTDDDSIKAGLSMDRLPYSIEEFKAKATALNLTLLEKDFSANTSTTLISEATHLEITTTTLDAGAVGTAESTKVTVPATSAAAQGDYFIIYNKLGHSFAVWLDLNAAGVVPNGPLFMATTYKIKVGIVTGGSAIANAALVKAAIEASSVWNGFETITDNGDGTLDIAVDGLGNVTNATRHNEAESGNGSFVLAITAGTGDYSDSIEAEGGVEPYTFELDSTSDDLPDGLTLSSDGVLSGVPEESGTFDLVVKVTDTFGQTDLSGTLTLTVSA
jgi:hypothetical protein